jgi:hypothetical protein
VPFRLSYALGLTSPTAECLRAASVRVAYCNSANGYDYSKQKRWDGELANYRNALASGVEPAGTTQKEIDKANRLSDITGKAFQA